MNAKKRLVQLALLQAEYYDQQQYLAKRDSVNPEIIKRLKMTGRLKFTKQLSYLFGIAGANFLIAWFVQSYTQLVWFMIRNRIAKLKKRGLKVIAIAGSYGKTSVKKYTYDILRTKYRTVATPESFNTVLGIAKCLEYEVLPSTEIFIAEIGAYHVGDITHLLKMVQPDFGILTGITSQHLERFGSMNNIIAAKLEIAMYMKDVGGPLVANGSDSLVKNNLNKLGIKPIWYKGEDRREINLAGAQALAKLTGMTVEEVKKVKVREVRSRFEMTEDRYGMKVIDDSFSSNEHGFVTSVEYLARQKKYTRVLVTPGLVELGKESRVIHEKLGNFLIGKVDLVILVGESERTQALKNGIHGQINIIEIEKTLDFMKAIGKLNLKKEPLVLLENDLTENY